MKTPCPTCKGLGTIDIADHKYYRLTHGTIPKYLFYQHPFSGWKDFNEAREALLDELVPAKSYRDLKGNLKKRRQSTAHRSTKWMQVLAGKAQDYFMQNGLEFPDTEDFWKWLEAAPEPNEEYPPLIALKERYEDEQRRLYPWRF